MFDFFATDKNSVLFDFDFYATDTDVVIINSDGIVTDAATHAAILSNIADAIGV
jgi:hypothetical protein